MKRIPATVYLLHFARPYHHAKHYTGYTALESVDDRIARHRRSDGARLLRACNAAGISYELARVWVFASIPDARAFERKLKRAGHAGRICPLCQEGKAHGREREETRDDHAAADAPAV